MKFSSTFSLCCALFAGAVLSEVLSSVAVYSDSLCSKDGRYIGVIEGMCYNHTGFNDFILMNPVSNPYPWFSILKYNDSSCSSPLEANAVIANDCRANPDGTTRVARISGTTWTMYFYGDCTTTDCGSCGSTKIVKENECAPYPNHPGTFIKGVKLGLGSGIFEVIFFGSTDGSCSTRTEVPPAQTKMVPDTTCYGEQGILMSSLQKERPHL